MFYKTLNNYFLLCHTNKIQHQVKIYQKCVDRVKKNSLKIINIIVCGLKCIKFWIFGYISAVRTRKDERHTNNYNTVFKTCLDP